MGGHDADALAAVAKRKMLVSERLKPDVWLKGGWGMFPSHLWVPNEILANHTTPFNSPRTQSPTTNGASSAGGAQHPFRGLSLSL